MREALARRRAYFGDVVYAWLVAYHGSIRHQFRRQAKIFRQHDTTTLLGRLPGCGTLAISRGRD